MTNKFKKGDDIEVSFKEPKFNSIILLWGVAIACFIGSGIMFLGGYHAL